MLLVSNDSFERINWRRQLVSVERSNGLKSESDYPLTDYLDYLYFEAVTAWLTELEPRGDTVYRNSFVSVDLVEWDLVEIDLVEIILSKSKTKLAH